MRSGARWLRTEWVVSRALCRYRILEFTSVPRAKRAAALRLQLSQFAPFTEPGYTVAWEGSAAQVWCWDAAKLHIALRDAGIAPNRARVVPESLYFAPLVEGPRLLKVAEGYEGQVWKDRELVRSRFWDQQPDAGQWIAFQRDAGVMPAMQHAEPVASEHEMLDQPYTKVGEGLANASPLALSEPLLLFLLVAALGTSTAWYAVRYAKLVSRSSELTTQAKALESSSAPVLAARQAAIENDVFAARLARIAAYPDQLALMAEIASAFSGAGVVLREWNFNVGKVRFVLVYTNAIPPIAGVVSAVEGQADFFNVRITPGNEPKSLVINADVKPVFKNDHEQSDS